MSLHGQRHGDLAGAQDLHGRTLAGGTPADQVRGSDFAALREHLAQFGQVNRGVLHTERVVEAAQLRQAHVQRQLPTFEAGAHLVTSLGALGSAACSLTLGGFASPHALAGLLGAGAPRAHTVPNKTEASRN